MIPPSFLPCSEKARGEDGCPFFGCEPCFELFLGFNRLHLPSSLFFFADLERDCFAALYQRVWKALIRGKIDKIVKHVPAVHLLGWRQPGFVLGGAGGQLLTILKRMKSLITTYHSQALIAWPRAEQRAQPQP